MRGVAGNRRMVGWHGHVAVCCVLGEWSYDECLELQLLLSRQQTFPTHSSLDSIRMV